SNLNAQGFGGILSMWFINPMSGFAVGQLGTFLETNDGGVSWTQLPIGTNQWLNDIYFLGGEEGYVVGDSGIILKCEIATSIDDVISEKKIEVFPNPTTNSINFNVDLNLLNISEYDLVIYDMLGRELLKADNIANNRFTIDMNDFTKGLYLYKLTLDSAHIHTGKILLR
ncbi:MAG: T9SS type A sorting domain-containing protein, partial [Bacteroidetes bacterium]|nr:T9SS type A sorting domain-containing protein [Bacteroidota bacterium]